MALLASVLLAAGAAAGCKFPQPVPTNEFVTDYDRMTGCYEPLVSLVYVPEQTALADFDGFIVGTFDVGDQCAEERQAAIGYAALFRVILQGALLRESPFNAVVLDEPAPGRQPGRRLLRLEGRIERFNTGSGILRYLHGLLFLFPSGATDFQIAGRLTDAATGRLVMEFVDRRRGIYNTPFGPNPRTTRADFAMRATVRDTAECLAAFLRQQADSLPATQSVGAPAANQET